MVVSSRPFLGSRGRTLRAPGIPGQAASNRNQQKIVDQRLSAADDHAPRHDITANTRNSVLIDFINTSHITSARRLVLRQNNVYHTTQMPGSETANRSRGNCRVALSVSMQVGVVLVLTGTRCLNAGSLSGTVMDESFVPLSEVQVKLLLQ